MTGMTDKQREQYWNAVNILRNLVEEGIDKEELLEEVEEDV